MRYNNTKKLRLADAYGMSSFSKDNILFAKFELKKIKSMFSQDNDIKKMII